MSQLRLNINGREVQAYSGQTILDVATENGIEIPTLCFSGNLEIYASCGLCLVEVEGAPKLLRACATQVAEGMIVRTENEKIAQARKLALELLLSDHYGDCSGPCVMACPANCDAQGYVALAANGQFKEALKLIKEFMPFPRSIGRVCPRPCEENCRRHLVEDAISIAYLKRLAGDLDAASTDRYMPKVEPATGKKIAVIGSGPAGITAAYFLKRQGHDVTVYEALPETGGMLRYGIPEYRLPKMVLDDEIQQVENLGVKIKTNIQFGEDFHIDYLFKSGFDAVYLAVGAQNSRRMGVPGEDMPGLQGGAEFLKAVMLNQPVTIGNNVAVVGGGNTAMDSARTAKRLGAENVYVVYRRAREQMPAQDIEVEEAEEEGVEFHLLASPVQIEGDGKVEKVKCQKMKLGEPDDSGRRRPEPIPDEFITLEVDTIIAAIGQEMEVKGIEDDVAVSKYKTIQTDEEKFTTSIPGVFAGGDCSTGPGIAIEAIAGGKRAAEVIHGFLTTGKVKPFEVNYNIIKDDLSEDDFTHVEKETKAKMPAAAPEVRVTNFKEVEQGLDADTLKKDAQRCLQCGCFDSFECKLRSFATRYDVKPERILGEKHKYDTEEHPFILREPSKCILCGLCVRTCSEIIGAEALGLVNRGFEAKVSPSLDLPLEETSCVACGQCVAACPTGALYENIPVEQIAAWEMEKTPSTCGFCGVGCNIQVETVGDIIGRVLPVNGLVNEGILCKYGRFGFAYNNSNDRLRKPLLKENGVLNEVSWDEAFLNMAKKAKSLKARFGGESLAVFASPVYTNEELYLIQKFARAILETNNINSLTQKDTGMLEMFGFDASTSNYDELTAADFILAVGADIPDYPIAGLKMKETAQKGTQLFVIDSEQGEEENVLQKYSARYFKVDEGTQASSLAALSAYIMEKGLANENFINENTTNFDKFKELIQSKKAEEWLTGSNLTMEDIAEIVDSYNNAKNPVLVLGSVLSAEVSQLLAALPVLLGKVGLPRRGILSLRARCNSQGLADLAINPSYLPGYASLNQENLESTSYQWKAQVNNKTGLNTSEVLEGIENGTIKGVFVFGESPDEKVMQTLKKAEFLVVSDVFITNASKEADVVLPKATIFESSGTMTNSERRIQDVSPALKPLAGMDNREIMQKIMYHMGYQQTVASPYLENEIKLLVPDYGKNGSFDNRWPSTIISLEDIKDKGGIKFPLTIGQLSFKLPPVKTSEEQWFINYLAENGL